jgi:NitT/TauT family transport system permease protein
MHNEATQLLSAEDDLAQQSISVGTPVTATGRRRGRILTGLGRLVSEYYITILTIIGVVVAWQLMVTALAVPKFLMPSPLLISNALSRYSSILLNDTRITLFETVVGFAAGSAFGLFLAILVVFSRVLEKMIYPPAILTQMVPKLAIAPLFVIWFGLGLLPKVMIILAVCMFPVLINAVMGMRAVDPRMLELMQSINASRWQTFRKIEFPNSLPWLFAGLKIGITMAVTGAVVGEWLGSNAGLGHQILMANSQLSTELLFASLVMLGVSGMVLFGAVAVAESLLLSGQQSINIADKDML